MIIDNYNKIINCYNYYNKIEVFQTDYKIELHTYTLHMLLVHTQNLVGKGHIFQSVVESSQFLPINFIHLGSRTFPVWWCACNFVSQAERRLEPTRYHQTTPSRWHFFRKTTAKTCKFWFPEQLGIRLSEYIYYIEMCLLMNLSHI